MSSSSVQQPSNGNVCGSAGLHARCRYRTGCRLCTELTADALQDNRGTGLPAGQHDGLAGWGQPVINTAGMRRFGMLAARRTSSDHMALQVYPGSKLTMAGAPKPSRRHAAEMSQHAHGGTSAVCPWQHPQRMLDSWIFRLTAAAAAGFVLNSASPNSSRVPPGMLFPPARLAWTCSGQAVPDIMGMLLPSFLAFAGPVPPELHLSGDAVIELLDMQIIQQTCPAAWVTVAQIIALPSGASLKPQSGFQNQLACDSIHGCTLDAFLNGVHYQAGPLPKTLFEGASRCSPASRASWPATASTAARSRRP